MTDLLPCPFCGGKPRESEGLNEHWISCMSCQASSLMRSNIDAAISAWNARTSAQGSPDAAQMWREAAEDKDKRINELEAMLERATLGPAQCAPDSEALIRDVAVLLARHDYRFGMGGNNESAYAFANSHRFEKRAAEVVALTSDIATDITPLDLAWEQINALGGYDVQNNSYDQGIVDTFSKALEIIERLGGEDAAAKRGRAALTSAQTAMTAQGALEIAANIAADLGWLGKPYPGTEIAKAIRDVAKHGYWTRDTAVTSTERHCQKCGIPTGGEEAYVDGQIWCHPCADEAALPPAERS